MAIEVFHVASIPRELATAGLEYIWIKWRTLNATSALTLQRLVDESDPPLHDRCYYLMPTGDDFACIYVGKDVEDVIRRDPTGTLLSLDEGAVTRDLADIYRRVIRDMAPAFIRFTAPRSPPGTLWHQAILPVRISDTTVILVCYTDLVSHQLEVYEHLFRTAAEAMAVASPITNDAGHVTDGWVLMMNDRAREMLGYQGPLANLRLSALPQFDGIDLWGRIYAPRSAVTSTLITARDFDIEILRFPHVFGLRLNPKLSVVPPGVVKLAPGASRSEIEALG
jgi:PAS domain-containing protein